MWGMFCVRVQGCRRSIMFSAVQPLWSVSPLKVLSFVMTWSCVVTCVLPCHSDSDRDSEGNLNYVMNWQTGKEGRGRWGKRPWGRQECVRERDSDTNREQCCRDDCRQFWKIQHNSVKREKKRLAVTWNLLKASQLHTVLSSTNQRREHSWDPLKSCTSSVGRITSRPSLLPHIISLVPSSVPIHLCGTTQQLTGSSLVQNIVHDSKSTHEVST